MPDMPLANNIAAPADEARSLQLFQASQTFLLRQPDPRVFWLRVFTITSLLLLFFAGVPLLVLAGKVPDYKVNVLGQYLCLAIVALGIDLVWGYTGLLSLCQALFFALGGYAMAMHLSLPEGRGQYDYPQFMTFAYYGHGKSLPPFWVPFRHFWFALLAGICIPGLVAGVFGFFILRSRVRGVYFSIITQAFAQAAWLLISRNEMLMGGTNGLTNFYRPMSSERRWIIGLYLLTLTVLLLAYLFTRLVVRSRLGRVLVAVRDKETRLYFAGYKPYAFKVFAFSVGAMLAGVGGMLYAPQMPIITPQNMNVDASIIIVVMVAIGGRGRLWGAIFGALLLSVAQSSLTTDFSGAWLLVLGVIAVSVVLIFPEGFAGLWASMERQIAAGRGVPRALLTVLPLAAVSLFVVAEALGLTPEILKGDTLHPLGIAPKYWLLLAVLALAGGLYWQSQRTLRRAAGHEEAETLEPSEARMSPMASATAKGGA